MPGRIHVWGAIIHSLVEIGLRYKLLKDDWDIAHGIQHSILKQQILNFYSLPIAAQLSNKVKT